MNGFWERVAFAFRCFFSILFHADIPNDLARKLVKPTSPVPQVPAVAASSVSRLKEVERPASEAFDRAVQMLALLQRDGRLIDELAEKLTIDPLLLRDRIDASPVRHEERRRGAERIGWSGRHAPGADKGPIKRGIGVAQSLWGANVQTNASCEVRLLRDGSVEILSSVQDIGTGIGTVLAQVVAEELGLRPQDITVRIGDTDFPAGPPSYGSRTTASITPPARNAAYKVKQMLFKIVAPHLGVAVEDLLMRGGRIVVRSDATRSLSLRDAAATLRTDPVGALASRSADSGGLLRA